ncbi:MAG: TetR family transcriptional regulator [Schumannella sp.]|nr:TetR family transcriptional regulator [Schumannella sp.]
MTDTVRDSALGEQHGDGRRERKKQQTRNALHEAAHRLVQEHGLEGTTIDQICLEADVSSRTFFNYFPSKAAAALGLPAEAVDAEAVERFRAATGSLVDALSDMITAGEQFAARQARVKRLVMNNPELIPSLTTAMTAARGRFVELAGERAASPAEAERAVTLVLAAVGFSVHSGDASDLLTAERLKATIDELVQVRSAPVVG